MRGRQFVWADREVQELTRQFVCVADECDHVAPRNQWAKKKLADDPGRKFFEAFGEKIPDGEWNTSGTATKQGVYAMTSDGDYLGAKFVGTRKPDVMKLLNGALTKWRELVRAQGLRPQPVPSRAPNRTWGPRVDAAGLLLQVHIRDLPRGKDRTPGEGWHEKAFNQNWLELNREEVRSLLPASGKARQVPAALVERIARESLIDNVRGQRPGWKAEDIEKAWMTSEAVKGRRGELTLRLQGEVTCIQESSGYDCRLYGRAVFDIAAERFTLFELVAAGQRWGAGAYNARGGDEAPAPMGVTFIIEHQYDRSGASSRKRVKARRIDREVMSGWEDELLERAQVILASGTAPTFAHRKLGSVTVKSVDAARLFLITEQRVAKRVALRSLKPADRAALAVALADSGAAEDAALAAFFLRVVREDERAEPFLARAPERAQEIRDATP